MKCDCPINYHKNGKTTDGYQRYRCPACGKSWSDSPRGPRRKKMILGDRPLTAKERYERQKETNLEYLRDSWRRAARKAYAKKKGNL